MKTMKKIFLAAVLLAVAASASAQSMYDAITFSQNNYYGTARSIAMGNAVTALGGDLGSIGINPAGSAVARHGQITITPGLTISSVSSAYSPEGENSYGTASLLTHTRMNLPNIGLSFGVETGRRTGLKGLTFSFTSNQTNNFHFQSNAFGTNAQTSMIAEFANAAWGIPEYYMGAARDPYYNSNYSWDLLTAYNGGMFGTYGFDGEYVGVTETIADDGSYHYVPDMLSQTSMRSKTGSKNDMLLNFGMNFSDRFYLGFNIGLPVARYDYSESFYEAALDPSRFAIVYDDGETSFQRGAFNYQYSADMDGIYAGVGFIYRMDNGLRVGASIQSPTALTVSERWGYSAATYYDDYSYNDDEYSPTGEYSYMLRTPYRASFGLAYTFGQQGVISADYELADYSVMRFSPVHMDRLYYSDEFEVQNMTNKYFAGVAHMVRVGAEFKLTPEFSVRGGWSMSTTPERWWTDNEGREVDANAYGADFYNYFNHIKNLVTPHYYEDRTQSYSAGLGYSSPGSFFADAAVRLTRYPVATFSPYYDYDSFDSVGNLLSVKSPRILDARDLWNVALTIGWRF